jgi:tetratricopeptide (TPR) repeat protein
MLNLPTNRIVLLAAFALLMSGCASSKGFKLSVESGGGDNRSEMAEHQTAFVSDDTRQLPEITGGEFEQLGDSFLQKGNLYLAYVQYEKSLRLKPGLARVEYKKGLTLLLAGKNEDAIKQFEAVVQGDPRFDLAYEGLGRCYFSLKDYGKAEAYFKKTIELNHRQWASYNYLGNIADLRSDYEQAILEYRSALSVAPEQGAIYNNLGVSNSMAGHHQEAVSAFAKALELNFREPRVYNNMGLALAHTGRYDQALAAFKRAGGEAQAYNNMGCFYLDQGKYPEAVKCFEMAIALEPAYYVKAADNLKKAKVLAAKQ